MAGEGLAPGRQVRAVARGSLGLQVRVCLGHALLQRGDMRLEIGGGARQGRARILAMRLGGALVLREGLGPGGQARAVALGDLFLPVGDPLHEAAGGAVQRCAGAGGQGLLRLFVAGEGLAPGRQVRAVACSGLGLQVCVRLGHALLQRGDMRLEVRGGAGQGLLRAGGQGLAGVLVLRQRLGPGRQAFAVVRGHLLLQRRDLLHEAAGGAVQRFAGAGGQGLLRLFVAGEGLVPGCQLCAVARGGLGLQVCVRLGRALLQRHGMCAETRGGQGQGLLRVRGQRLGAALMLRQRIGPGGQALCVARIHFLLQPRMGFLHGLPQRVCVLRELGGGVHQRLLGAAGQALVRQCLLRQLLAPALFHAAGGAAQLVRHLLHELGRTLREDLREAVQRVLQAAALLRLGAALVGQRIGPGLGHAFGAAGKALGQLLELLLHALGGAGVQGRCLARHAGHRGLHGRLDRRASQARAFGQAVLERAVDRAGQAVVGRLGAAVEALLVGQQAFVQALALAFHALYECVQAFHEGGHGLGLPAQQCEGVVTPLGLGEGAQQRAGRLVELQAGELALAACQRGRQPQHGGRGHTGQRGAKGHAQAGHRCGQRGAHAGQVHGTLQRQARAAQRDHHAQEGAQHAQQHQQPGQVGRQRRAGQRGALALDAQTHGMAQRGRHLLQPGLQRGRRGVGAGQHAGQLRAGLAKTVQLQCTAQEEGTDQRRDGQRQQMAAARVAGADPGNAGQAREQGKVVDESVHGLRASQRFARRVLSNPSIGCHRRSSSASSTLCSSCWNRVVQSSISAASRRCLKRFSSSLGMPDSSRCSCAPITCSITVSTAASRANAGERAISAMRSRPRSGSMPVAMLAWRASTQRR